MKDSIVKLLKERYFAPEEESWEQLANRISRIYPDIKQDLIDFNFVPSSPTLMNYNVKGKTGTLSSCFPMGIEDSIEGIYESLKETAITTKYGGGVGYDFTELRSSREGIKGLNGRKSSGPIPFIKNFNAALDSIQQGGVRRGAGMGVLDITHGDIVEFIKAKENTTEINRLNLSVGITNDFYTKLEKSPNIIHQVKDKEGNYYDLEYKGKKITVKELWNLIVYHSWKTAEPGIINKDIAFNQCTTTNVSKTVLQNPCFTGDTLIAVAGSKNDVTIKELAENNKSFLVYSASKKSKLQREEHDHWKTEIKKAVAFKTGNKDVYKISLNNGDSFTCTEDHLLALYKGEYIKAKDSYGSRMSSMFTFKEKNYILINSFSNGYARQHRLVYEFFNGSIPKGKVIHHLNYDSDNIENLQMLSVDEHNDLMKIERLSDGNPIHNMDKTYHSYICQKASIGKNNANSSGISNLEIIELAKILYKENKEIPIENLIKLDNRVPIHFGNYRFNKKISNLIDIIVNNKEYKEPVVDKVIENPNKEKIDFEFYSNDVFVVNIEYIGKEDVYDLTVEDNHNFYIYTGKNKRGDNRGILVHNCSEFVNIPYSSCNLGSINLSHLVNNKKFDWEKFEKIIVYATRFLNNVIDVNSFPLKKIEKVTKQIRPIGLGVMGFAHMLYKKGIQYNSEQAYKLAHDIFYYLTLRSMQESIELAKEYKIDHPRTMARQDEDLTYHGAYEAFDYTLFMKANERFFVKKKHKNIDIEQLEKDIKKYGVRNSCFTSIAPTGSIGFIADTSGGIEPVFALTYSRKIEKLNREYETIYISDPIFEEYLNEKFNEDDKIKILKHVADNKGSCQTCKLIPEEDRKIFVIASDILPEEHVRMLGYISRNTSLSVSKTVNLPNNATEEDVAKVLIQAHKEGVIGVTTYRDGCREGILVHSTIDDKPAIVKTNSPKRPKSLPCHVYKISTSNRETKEGEKWVVFVGLLEGEPYEIIAGKIDLVDIPSSITEGIVTKVKSGLYQFEYNGEVIIKDITKAFLNDIQEHTTRLMSWGLRHGGGINFLKDVLEKSKGTLVDFNKAIIRAINKYVKDVSLKEKCPICDSELIFVEGCVSCKNPECSYSRCS